MAGEKRLNLCYKRQMTSTSVKVIWADFGSISTLVRRMRLELTRSCDHYPLKVACIPISPPALGVPRTGLEPAHLAACAPETHASTNSAIWAKKKSGKRDSNSRPRPWQGRALPTELFPQFFLNNKLKIAAFSLNPSEVRLTSFFKSGCKSTAFF